MVVVRPLIAVLDDEPGFCEALARRRRVHGYEVATLTRGVELSAAYASRIPHRIAIALLAAVAFTTVFARAADPLPSWNDGKAKQQPMLEALAYLRANDFKTFTVSGGGIENQMLTVSFESFTFSPAGAAVYQLGPYGTAAKQVKRWDLKR